MTSTGPVHTGNEEADLLFNWDGRRGFLTKEINEILDKFDPASMLDNKDPSWTYNDWNSALPEEYRTMGDLTIRQKLLLSGIKQPFELKYLTEDNCDIETSTIPTLLRIFEEDNEGHEGHDRKNLMSDENLWADFFEAWTDDDSTNTVLTSIAQNKFSSTLKDITVAGNEASDEDTASTGVGIPIEPR